MPLWREIKSITLQIIKSGTVEPRFNEVAGNRPNLFIKWRVRYIKFLFHTFYCNFGRDIEIIPFVISRTSLNRGSLNRGSTVHVEFFAAYSVQLRRSCLLVSDCART